MTVIIKYFVFCLLCIPKWFWIQAYFRNAIISILEIFSIHNYSQHFCDVFCFCGDYHWCPYTTAIDKLLLKKFLKSHSTSALPSYRLVVVSLGPLLARFSTCSFLKLRYSIRLTVIFATTYDYCQSLFLYECHRHQTDTCRTICVAMTLENSLFMA